MTTTEFQTVIRLPMASLPAAYDGTDPCDQLEMQLYDGGVRALANRDHFTLTIVVDTTDLGDTVTTLKELGFKL